jgi:hypothetical protein
LMSMSSGGTLGIRKREGWPLDVFAHVRGKYFEMKEAAN